MTITTHARGDRRRLQRAGETAFGIATACIIVATGVFWNTSGSWSSVRRSSNLSLAIAVVVYFTSHCVRVLRLAVLVGDPKVSLKQIGLVHFLTAAISFITPFKLGEIYRISEVAHLLSNIGRGLVVVWVERAFDFAAITALVLLAALAQPRIVSAIQPLILLSMTYVAATLLLFMVFPEALRSLNLFVVRKYEGAKAIRRLQVIEWFQSWITLGPQVVAHRIALLTTLTIAIWGLELTALGVLLPAASDLRQLAAALPVFLAAVSSGGFSLSEAAGADDYRLMLTATLLVFGSLAGLAYAPTRFRRIARRHSSHSYQNAVRGVGR